VVADVVDAFVIEGAGLPALVAGGLELVQSVAGVVEGLWVATSPHPMVGQGVVGVGLPDVIEVTGGQTGTGGRESGLEGRVGVRQQKAGQRGNAAQCGRPLLAGCPPWCVWMTVLRGRGSCPPAAVPRPGSAWIAY
jgi:hypothetical protein